MIAIFRKDSAPCELDIATFADLSARLPFVRYSRLSPLAQQIETHLQRLGIKPPRSMEFNTSEAIAEMVYCGLGWTITTPLCLLQSRIALHELDIRKLPIEGMSRTVTLLARKRELGGLPGRLSELSRQILANDIKGRISAEVPWLTPQIRINRDIDGVRPSD